MQLVAKHVQARTTYGIYNPKITLNSQQRVNHKINDVQVRKLAEQIIIHSFSSPLPSSAQSLSGSKIHSCMNFQALVKGTYAKDIVFMRETGRSTNSCMSGH